MNINKDKMGMILSAGCLIHCILMPIILPILPLFGLAIKHEALLHLILAGIITVIAAVTLIPGYIKHKSYMSLLLGAIGVSYIIMAGLVELIHEFPLTLTTIIGSILLIIAHYINHKKLCNCKHHASH